MADSIKNIFQNRLSAEDSDEDYEYTQAAHNADPILSAQQPDLRLKGGQSQQTFEIRGAQQRPREIMTEGPGQGSVDQSRRTEKITYQSSSQHRNTEGKDAREEDDPSYSINSFTHPKIRQTLVETIADNRKARLEYGDEEVDDMLGEMRRLRSDGVPGTLTEEEPEEDSPPVLNPSNTFGKGMAGTDLPKDRSGLKLSTYDVWTKDRVRMLLPDKGQVLTMEALLGGKQSASSGVKKPLVASVASPQPFQSHQGLKQSEPRKNMGKKNSMDKMHVPVVGIDLKVPARKASYQKSGDKPETKIESQIAYESHQVVIKKPIVLKQKDFGAFGSSDSADHLKALETVSDTIPKREPATIQTQVYARPTQPFHKIISPVVSPTLDSSNLRATADFGSVRPGAEKERLVKVDKREEKAKEPSSPARPMSEMGKQPEKTEKERGYADIQMARLQQKREQQSSRSVLSTKSAATQGSDQQRKLIQARMADTSVVYTTPNSAHRFLPVKGKSSDIIEKLYRHAFYKQEVEASIRRQLDKQKRVEEMKGCTFRPMINEKSRNMPVTADYSFSCKSYKRPLSSDQRSSHSTEKTGSVKSEVA